MYRLFEFPQRYVQGRGVLAQAGKYLADLGRSFAVIADATVEALVRTPLTQGLAKYGFEVWFIRFGGECHRGEVRRLATACQGVDAGAGGGRAIDTAKLVGKNLSLPVFIYSTSASTDVPVSRIAALNWPDGSVEEVLLWPPGLRRGPASKQARYPIWRAPTWAGIALAHQCWEDLRKRALPALAEAGKGLSGHFSPKETKMQECDTDDPSL